MIELKIDGKPCDLGDAPVIPIGFNIERLSDIESGEGQQLELALPSTPRNDLLFGSSRDLYAKHRFNEVHHTASIVKQGLTLFEGDVHLLSTDIVGGYRLRIVERGHEWHAMVADRQLAQLGIDFSGNLTLSTIEHSWEGDNAVRFLPVYRGDYEMAMSKDSIHPVEQVLLTDDFHPFVSVGAMVRQIFADCGYTLRSDLFDSSFASSLYMSGDYTRSDVEADKSKCDFLARRQNDITVSADFFGRVYASNAFVVNTVGNIVDTINPEAVDSNGKVMSETFSTGDCFRINEDGQACFVPPTAVSAGFLLKLNYTTDYRIATRERLTGFDTFEGLNGVHIDYLLRNSFKDHRQEVLPNMSYTAFVFNHKEGRTYRLVEQTSLDTLHTMGEWSARSAKVATSDEGAPVDIALYFRDSSSGAWELFEEDWALYADNVEECGRVDVDMMVRIPPVEVSADRWLALDEFWFGGAEPGMNFTLRTATSLRPYFTNLPGYGSPLNYADIAPKAIRQGGLLKALTQMFNLVFLTDEEQRSVRVEPLEWLSDRSDIVDWSDRIDLSQAILLSDTGIDRPRGIELSYTSVDKASHTFNLENDTELGCWRWNNSLNGVKEYTRHVVNPLFTTTLNIDKVLGFAPSASILQVGDIEKQSNRVYGAFTPRIVCYLGTKPLPDGEYWGVASNSASDKHHYPYATFVDGRNGVNLCFEERDGVAGLSRFYLPQLLREQYRQELTLTLRLTPNEIIQLAKDNGLSPSVRTLYRFTILGENSIFRLAEVERWDTSQTTIRCKFQREMYD